MTFDPNDFLRIAYELGQEADDEAKLRTAVGRAYYAVFLRARERLGIRQRRYVHRLVIGALRRSDRAAGDQLDKLEQLRGFADYDLVVNDPIHQNWAQNWQTASSFASHIWRRLDRLRPH